MARETPRPKNKDNLGRVPQNRMFDQEDRNYVSTKSWMGMMFVTAIPVIGWLMILIWAFSGDNQSRKNYFRAILSWLLVFVVLGAAAAFTINWLGDGPALQKFIQEHQR